MEKSKMNKKGHAAINIMATEEDESVVRFIKLKNKCMQALHKKEIEKLILDVLRIRDSTRR